MVPCAGDLLVMAFRRRVPGENGNDNKIGVDDGVGLVWR